MTLFHFPFQLSCFTVALFERRYSVYVYVCTHYQSSKQGFTIIASQVTPHQTLYKISDINLWNAPSVDDSCPGRVIDVGD